MKACTKCGEHKKLEDYRACKRNKDNHDNICKQCRVEKNRHNIEAKERKREYDLVYRLNNKQSISNYKKKWYDLHAEELSERARIYRENNIISVLIQERKYRTREEFTVTEDDFDTIPDVCPILGIPLIVSNLKTSINSPSIDRIDNSKGYVKGNVWIISHLANRMKNNANYEQLYYFCKWIIGEGFESNEQANYDKSNNLRGCKDRAKRKNLPFDITIDDIKVPEVCPALGVPLKRTKKGFDPWVASVDRIIPELGYVKGNIQVISVMANTMKNLASNDLLLKFANWFLNYRSKNE